MGYDCPSLCPPWCVHAPKLGGAAERGAQKNFFPAPVPEFVLTHFQFATGASVSVRQSVRLSVTRVHCDKTE